MMPNRCALCGSASSLVSVPDPLQHRLLGEIDLFFRNAGDADHRGDRADALPAAAGALKARSAEALEREAAVERALLARAA